MLLTILLIEGFAEDRKLIEAFFSICDQVGIWRESNQHLNRVETAVAHESGRSKIGDVDVLVSIVPAVQNIAPSKAAKPRESRGV